jgi:hypothetical protein
LNRECWRSRDEFGPARGASFGILDARGFFPRVSRALLDALRESFLVIRRRLSTAPVAVGVAFL